VRTGKRMPVKGEPEEYALDVVRYDPANKGGLYGCVGVGRKQQLRLSGPNATLGSTQFLRWTLCVYRRAHSNLAACMTTTCIALLLARIARSNRHRG
jgi:hypothetical protein